MARPSEVATKQGGFYVKSSFRRRVMCLSEGESRSGESFSPERECVGKPLFHTRSSEVG
ncbi:hypothetical protein DEO72_LG6g922 [Vigna unguiculata]|uniref:Uncharacterized protein n=1 Tax=Vigna unguiculata TaxID=3917 RepID=A0A4D6M6D2_VIGUN|nr:hypothetical protein DEO72_LG6g922 [Vigna unguiculata]